MSEPVATGMTRMERAGRAPVLGHRWLPRATLATCLAIVTAGGAAVDSQAPLSRDPSQLRAGMLLYAVPQMADPRFAETVVLVLKHSRDGTLGVVINQPSTVTLSKALPQLPEARRSEVPVHWGGPVQPEVSIVLMRQPGASQRTERILQGVYMTTDLDDLRGALDMPRPERDVRVYSGYSGWSRGQLASEMQKGQWVIDAGDASMVFAPDTTQLWERVHTILKRREARRPSPLAAAVAH